MRRLLLTLLLAGPDVAVAQAPATPAERVTAATLPAPLATLPGLGERRLSAQPLGPHRSWTFDPGPVEPVPSTGLAARRRPSEEGSRWRPALVASAAVAVGGAAVAYWSTDRADAAYERYLRSAGEARQRDALDRAERYDRLAGAAFLVMEAGLVLSAYFTFF